MTLMSNDLVLTLGNMLKQDKQAKMDKFVETVPTIRLTNRQCPQTNNAHKQTHLIIAPNWEEVTKKAKNFIHQCEPLAIDDGTQFEQYGPLCALSGGFNHSPKHCFKGEHDINNLMEKMSLGSNNQHQNGLYQ